MRSEPAISCCLCDRPAAGKTIDYCVTHRTKGDAWARLFAAHGMDESYWRAWVKVGPIQTVKNYLAESVPLEWAEEYERSQPGLTRLSATEIKERLRDAAGAREAEDD